MKPNPYLNPRNAQEELLRDTWNYLAYCQDRGAIWTHINYRRSVPLRDEHDTRDVWYTMDDLMSVCSEIERHPHEYDLYFLND